MASTLKMTGSAYPAQAGAPAPEARSGTKSRFVKNEITFEPDQVTTSAPKPKPPALGPRPDKPKKHVHGWKCRLDHAINQDKGHTRNHELDFQRATEAYENYERNSAQAWAQYRQDLAQWEEHEKQVAEAQKTQHLEQTSEIVIDKDDVELAVDELREQVLKGIQDKDVVLNAIRDAKKRYQTNFDEASKLWNSGAKEEASCYKLECLEAEDELEESKGDYEDLVDSIKQMNEAIKKLDKAAKTKKQKELMSVVCKQVAKLQNETKAVLANAAGEIEAPENFFGKNKNSRQTDRLAALEKQMESEVSEGEHVKMRVPVAAEKVEAKSEAQAQLA